MDLYTIRKSLNKGLSIYDIPLRVTIYARVSTLHNEQQSSLHNQINHFEEMIKNTPKWTYVKSYIDSGISGTTDIKREQFMKMIEDAEEDKFDLIITKEISRFSRNTLDSIKYTRILLNYGVFVYFVNDNINTSMSDSELRLTIMASMAQDEVRRLSERVKFGMQQSIKNGHILGNNRLYGYHKDKKSGKLIIIPEEAINVEKIFILYAINNQSLRSIATYFNNHNIKTNQGNNWSSETLSRMIKNPKYKGYYCGHKVEIIDYMSKKKRIIPSSEWVMYQDTQHIPPIVNEELWNLANQKIKDTSKKRINTTTSLLSSKIKCALDNETYHRRIQCHNGEVSYICAKYLRLGKKACSSANIRESELITILKSVLDKLSLDITSSKIKLNNIYQQLNNQHSILKKYSLELTKLYTRQDNLIELVTDNLITKEEFTKRHAINNNAIKDIKTKINNIKDNKQINMDSFHLESILPEIISLILNKIYAYQKDFKIYLTIYLNITYISPYYQEYYFKRGYNTTSTKRYTIKYCVKFDNITNINC